MNTSRFKRKIRRGQHTPPTPGAVLTAADFTYLGSITGNNNFAEGSVYSLGIGHRYVGGELRFLVFAHNEHLDTDGGTLVEFKMPAGGFGSSLSRADWTNSWKGIDVWQFRDMRPFQAAVDGFQGGLNYDDGRLWTSIGIDYASNQTQLMTCGVCACELSNSSPGVVSNYHGLYGFEGVSGRALSGTVRKNPQWFQDAYGVGPFMYGCGGGAFSVVTAGVMSWGLFLLAGNDITAHGYAQHTLNSDGVPDGYPDPGDGSDWTVPASAFVPCADHRTGTLAAVDWYDSYTGPGYVPPFDRGYRFSTNYLNYLDGGDGGLGNGLPGDASISMTVTLGSDTVTWNHPVNLPVTFTNAFHSYGTAVSLDGNGLGTFSNLAGPVSNSTIGVLLAPCIFASGTGAWHYYANPNPQGAPFPKSGSSGGQWLSPAPDGLGRMNSSDLYRATGCWIDGPSRRGYVTVGNFVGGGVWYFKYGNQVVCPTTVAEIHIFDPADLGACALGTKNAWNVQPVDHLDITATLVPLGLCTNQRTQGGQGPQGACFDSVAKRLWVFSPYIDPAHDASGYGWALSCWQVDC